uniref:ABC-type glutathione-S-conjugate transporter n=1 Tax=Aceria tosichella TaxID=561515 RepID=A0A6G1SLE4_9ACAR
MEVCDSKLFDVNNTWYTDRPQFSACFRDTVLVWLPACVLLLTISNEFSNILRAKSKGKTTIPWNSFNLVRLLLVLVLFCLKLLELSSYVYGIITHQELKEHGAPATENGTRHLVISAILVPVIQSLSYLILGILYHFQRKVGRHTSGPIWFYLFISVICTAIDYYSVILYPADSALNDIAVFIDYTHLPLLILLFILECCGDKPVLELDEQDMRDNVRPINPEAYVSYCSSIFHCYFDRFLLFGYRSQLRLLDLWRTLPRDRSSRLAPIFYRAWTKTSPKVSSKKRETYYRADGQIQGANDMTKVLLKLFGTKLLFAASLKFMQDILQFVVPSILKAILAYLKSDNIEWHGYFIAALLLAVPTLQSVILSNYFHRMNLIALQIRAMIMGVVYRKAILLSGSSRLQSTSGEIVNLMSVDAQRFQDLLMYANLIWSAPLQIVLAVVLLYRELGWPVFAGVLCMVLFLPCNAYLARRLKLCQVKLMNTKDERIKHINEIFGGIRVIKLYAWENSFIENLFKYRNRELGFLNKIQTLDATQIFLWQCCPFVVACVTFAVYVSVDSANVLDAEKAFVSISLFNLLKFPLSMLPSLITSFVLTMVSSRRLSKFLNSDELVEYVTRNDDPNQAITIENATMAWTANSSEINGLDGKPGTGPQAILRNVSMQVKKGSFVAIVGQVASGKSSLISSILGEMYRISGRLNISGSLNLAYVPQRAFIQNMSVKDNILFGSECNQERYNRVLAACSLQADLETLPGGDQAEIGEKGINLSGGQKQRVSLARACYSDSDIVLLDDPLSALDSHVAKHVYDEVLSSTSGLLRDKTRVLATNSLFVLPHVDQIVVLDGGRVVESGTYGELMGNKNGNLAEIMRQYNVNQDADSGKSERVTKTIALNVIKSPTLDAKTNDAKLTKAPGSQPTQPPPPTSGIGKLIDDENMEKGTVSYRVYMAYFFTNYTPFWLLATLIAMSASSGFNVATNMWLALWSSDSADPIKSKDTHLRTTRLLVYTTLGGLQCLTIWLGSLAVYRGAVRAARNLHCGLLDRVMHSPMTFFDTTPLGRVVNRFAKDIDVVDTTLPGSFRSWLSCIMVVLSTVFVVCYTFPGLLALVIPISIIYMIIQRIFIVTTRQLKRLESTTRSPIYSNFSETLSGVSTIRAYNCVDRFVNYSDNVVDIDQSCSWPNVIANRWLSVRLEFLGNMITSAAALFAVAYRVDPGAAGLTISYSMSITSTLSWMVRMNSDLETHIVSVERILEYMDNEQEDRWIKEECRPPQNWPQSGSISFQHYSTRYRKETDLVLKDVSIDIKPREKIGIVGRTGSGKSSLSLTLFRILERTSGTILIDSLDITKFGLHDIRSRLTIIPQDPVLFSGTLRFNLDPLRLYSDLDIWRALELAHLRPYINTLSMGLDYQVSEYGENFSVGQRQLICLARAILRKTKILVLDEATASVDLETDAIVQKTIRDVFQDCTIITIAHRLHTILDSDRIIVLDSGRIMELGSPSELIQNDQSAFRSLVRDAGIDVSQLRANTPSVMLTNL